MSGRAEELAKRSEQANDELIAAVQSRSNEQGSVGVTAHHVGTSYGPIAGMVQALATGQPVPPLTAELLDASNAEHARQFAGCTKEETIELLRSGGKHRA